MHNQYTPVHSLTFDVVLAHVQVAGGVQCEAGWAHAAAELVEHAGMEDARGLLEEPQNSIRHHLSHESANNTVFNSVGLTQRICHHLWP